MKKASKNKVIILIAVLAVAAAVYLMLPRHKARLIPEKPREVAPVVPAQRLAPPEIPPPPVAEKPTKPTGAKVAIIVDDMGMSVQELDTILAIGAPISVAVMPCQRHSRDVAVKAEKAGLDVLLHLPMQPREKVTGLGQGALMAGLDAAGLEKVLSSDLATVPGAAGVNNHMGSLLTEDRAEMHALMARLRQKGIFFVDSRTTAGSVAYDEAVKAGVKAVSRDVFLDNDADPAYINGQLDKLAKMAVKRGYAVGICHPRPATLAALRAELPRLKAAGVAVVRVSELAR